MELYSSLSTIESGKARCVVQTSLENIQREARNDLDLSSDRQPGMNATSRSRTTTRAVHVLERADTALRTDFCPWANRWVYWLKNPVWVLVLAVVGSLLCGILLNPLVLILTALLVAVGGVGIVLPWLAMRGIRCRIVFDVRRAVPGQPTIVRLQVTNRWPVPVWGLSLIQGFAEPSAGAGLRDGNEGVALARVPGWATVEYSWPFEPRRRGLYPNAPAEVETGFPFGLFHARRTAAVEGHLVVWPQTTKLEGLPDASESRMTEDQFSDRRVGEFGDMLGTRAFRNGDSLRRVHWSQTARQQTLIVTERQAPAMSSVRVILDLDAGHHPEKHRFETVEACVQVAASICDSLHRQHCRVELSVHRDVYVAGEAVAGFQRLMDALAVVQAESANGTAASRRNGFEIRITTPAGFLPGVPHQIVVHAAGDSGGSTAAWMQLDADRNLAQNFADQWRKKCHAG